MNNIYSTHLNNYYIPYRLGLSIDIDAILPHRPAREALKKVNPPKRRLENRITQ